MSGRSKNADSGYHPQKGGAHSSANKRPDIRQTFARHSPDIRQETAREPKTSLFRQETADDPNPFRIMLFSTV